MKSKLKEILKKFTWIDLVIIVCVLGAVAFAFIHIGSDDDKQESVSFDSSTFNKLGEKYLSFYREGKVIKTHVGGYNSSSGKYEELYGTVLWICDYKGTDIHVLIDVDGHLVLAGLYKEVSDADLYIEQITLEAGSEKYKNLTEIKVKPKNITTLNDIVKGIPKGANYTVETKIAIDSKDSQLYQKLKNELYFKYKKDSIKTLSDDIRDQIVVTVATAGELNLGSQILGNLNGESDIITIRLYNTNEKDIEAIKNSYDVISLRKIT